MLSCEGAAWGCESPSLCTLERGYRQVWGLLCLAAHMNTPDLCLGHEHTLTRICSSSG